MSNREAYEQKLRAKLDEWQAEIDKLKAQARGADADARIEREKEAERLEERREEVRRKLEELREAGDDAWDDIRAGAERAWESMSDAFEKVVNSPEYAEYLSNSPHVEANFEKDPEILKDSFRRELDNYRQFMLDNGVL